MAERDGKQPKVLRRPDVDIAALMHQPCLTTCKGFLVRQIDDTRKELAQIGNARWCRTWSYPLCRSDNERHGVDTRIGVPRVQKVGFGGLIYVTTLRAPLNFIHFVKPHDDLIHRKEHTNFTNVENVKEIPRVNVLPQIRF